MPQPRPVDPNVVQSLQLLLGEKVDANERTVLEGMAEFYLLLGRTAEGLSCLQEAKNLHRKKFDFKGDARVLRKLGDLFLARGERTEALRAYQQSLHSARETDDRRGEAAALDLMARMLQAEQRFADAVKAYEETLAIKDATGDGVGQARTLMQLGEVYAAMGRYQDSLRAFRQAVALWKKEGNQAEECRCLIEILTDYLTLGRFADVVNTAAEVLGLLDALGLDTPRGPIVMLVGMAWRGLGEWEHALGAFTHALETSRREGDRARLIACELALARTLRDAGRGAEGLKLLQTAESDAKEGDARHMVGDVLLERGMALLAAGHAGEAGKVLAESAKLLTGAGVEDRAAQAWIYAAAVAIRTVGPNEAENCLVKAHALAQAADDTHQLSVIYAFRGVALWLAGRQEEALRWVQQGADLMDDPARIHRLSEEAILGPLVRPFEALVELAHARGEASLAFQAAQRAHAHACVQIAENLVLADKAANGTGAVGHCERLLAQMRGSNVRMEGSYDAGTRRLLRARVHELRGDLKKHQDSAASHHPEYTPLRFVQPLEAAEVQKLLGPDQAVLVYLVGDRRTWLWLVSAQDVSPFTYSVGRADLARMTEGLADALAGQQDAGLLTQHSLALANAILGDTWDLLARFSRLLIVPDDCLWNVPFAALTSPRGLMATQWELAVAPSLSLWRACQQKARHGGRLLGGKRPVAASEPRMRTRGLLGGHGPAGTAPDAPPAAAATAEAEAPEAAAVAMVTATTDLQGMEDARRAALVHVAVPLDWVPATPFGSAFRLADGAVSLYDLARHGFSASLVVFSGTEAGDGGRQSASLFMPLLYAGLPAMVYRRWPVPEAALQAFSQGLFSRLQGGAGRAQAVRETMLDLMGRAEFAHPHCWAAFELMGAWS